MLLYSILKGDYMENNIKFILKEFLQFIQHALITIVLLLIMFGIIYVDMKQFGSIPELSLTEIIQELLLLSSACIFSLVAYKHQRQGVWLVAGFLFCMFVRELDGIFDLIFHGAWKYIALPLAVFFIFLAFKNGLAPVLEDLAHFMKKRNYRYLFLALILILIVSRIVGCLSLIKLVAIHDNINQQYLLKNFLEEGTELVGYLILFFTSCCYYLEFHKESKEMQ